MTTLSPRIKRFVLLFAWILTMVTAFAAGVMTYRHRGQIRSLFQSVQQGKIVATNLYNITIEKVTTPGAGRYGAIAAYDQGLLLSAGDGRLWYVGADKKLVALRIRVPINVSEFSSDNYNETTEQRDNFAVKDLLVQPTGAGARVFASHNQWYAEPNCNTLRISMIELSRAELIGQSAGAQPQWRTVYESAPCRELTPVRSGNRAVTLGAGGRMVALSENEVLVTVGGFGPENETGGHIQSQDPTTSYGKTILVDVATGKSRVYTLGHRNPQGLAAASPSEIWLTEHAARGGDELNRIVDGKNYGYPFVSYGTQYESMVWKTNPRQGHHEGYEPATFAWVPSIGISQLLVVQGTAFPHWKGDLLVSSLGGRAIHRVSVQNGRAAFVEPIAVEHRLRDIAELSDGTIVLKADDNYLLYLTPITAAAADDPTLSPAERGAILASSTCAACHTLAPGAQGGIGPNLAGVVGRDIAGVEGFNYSDSLKRVDGRWTPDRLRAFLADPNAFAPGTTMAMTTSLTETQIADVIAYLESLR